MRKQVKRLTAAVLGIMMLLQIAAPFSVQAAEAKKTTGLELNLEGEDTPVFEYGKAKELKLVLKNKGTETVEDITIEPKLSTDTSKWPFSIEKVSYEREIEKVEADKSETVSYKLTPRSDVKTGEYKIVFSVTYGDETFKKQMYVKMTGKPEDKEPDKKPEQNVPSGNQNGTSGNQGGSSGGEVVYNGGDFGGGAVVNEGTSGETGGSSGTPRVIVTGFSTDPGEVKAGSNFRLIVHLKNTSKTTAVKNMLFDFSAPTEGSDESTASPAFLPSSGSSTVYLESIKANGTKDISIDLNAKADLVQKPYSIEMSMKYEDKEGNQFEGSSSISVPVKQDARFEFSEFEMSSDYIEVGGEVNVMCSLYNLGRIKLYNLKARFEGEGIQSKELFIGNVDPGATASIDGMITGEAVTTGDGKMKLVISYEDEAGTISTAEKELTLFVTEPVMEEVFTEDGMAEVPEEKSFPVIPVVVAVLIVAAVIAVIIVRKEKKRRKIREEEDILEDELDRLTEDERG